MHNLKRSMMRSSVIALALALFFCPPVFAASDVAPMPEEVIQALVQKPLKEPGNSLPRSLKESLATAIRDLDEVDRDEEAAVVESKSSRLTARRSDFVELRARTEDQLGRARAGLVALGLMDKAASLDLLAKKIEERFDRVEKALAAVGKGSAQERGRAARSAKTLLTSLLRHMDNREALPDRPVTTFRQDEPLPKQPLPEAGKLPQYLSDLKRLSKGYYAFNGDFTTLLAAAPPIPAEAQKCSYTSDDLAQTQEEVKQTPEIAALAQQLEYSPLKIFKYVYDNITYEPYYGSLKGAQGVLLSGAGNDTDQASLLIALLRASNIPARYVKGVARIIDERPMGKDGRAARWVGAKDYSGVAGILSQGRNPYVTTLTNTEGQKIGVDLVHVWVEACVPYSHYRGATIDNAGHCWIPLDPSFKDKMYQKGLANTEIFDYDSYLAERTNGPDSLPHEAYARQVEAKIKKSNPNASLNDVPYCGTLVPSNRDILPASLPYDVPLFLPWDEGSSSAETATLPEGHRYKLKITVKNSSDTQLASTTLTMPEQALKRITLSFKGATTADQTALDNWREDGNLSSAVPCTIKVVPVIKSEAVEQVVGTATSVGFCTEYNKLNMQVLLPELGSGDCLDGSLACANSVNYSTIKAANYHSLQAYAFQASDRFLAERSERLLATVKSTSDPDSNLEETEGEYLNLVGLKYMRYITDAGKKIGGLDGGSGESGNHLGVVASQMKVEYLFDLPYAVNRKGFLIDVAGALCRNADLSTGSSVYKTFLLTGYSTSAYESYIWQENSHLDAVSTVRGLQYARETGIEILVLTSANWAAESPKLTSNTKSSLNYASSEIQAIKAYYIDQGFTVTMPRSLIQYGDWKGSVYVAEINASPVSQATFAIGRYAGGYTIGDPLLYTLLQPVDTGYFQPVYVPSSANPADQPPVSVGGGNVGNGNPPGNTTEGDPVNMVTGNMYHVERDIAIAGRGGLPIVFERSYNSRNALNGPLGYGWTHSFNHFIKFYGVEDGMAKVSWMDGTGNEKFFATTKHTQGNITVNTALTNPPGIYCSFRRLSDGKYRIREKNGLVYLFQNVAGTAAGGQKAKLLSITDRNGNSLTLTYTNGKLTQVKDALNRALTFTYTGNRITQIEDFTGRIYQYGYDGNADLKVYRNPLAVSSPETQPPVRYTYYSAADGVNLNHAMKSYQLPRGNGMTFEYYANGRVFRHTNSLGETSTFSYNDFRRESVQVNERGNERRFFFDAYGNPLKIIEENGGEHDYTYDPANPYNRLTKEDPLGYRTSYAYDSRGNVTKVTSPRKSAVQFSNFTAFNRPQRIKDGRGNYTVLKYDSTGNLTEEIRLKAGVVPAIPYTPVANQIVAWRINTYDSYGNLLSTKRVRYVPAQLGPTTTITYDADSLYPTGVSRLGDKNGDGKINASDPADSQPLVYDSLGRVRKGIDADWQPIRFTYDTLDRIKTGTDPLGKVHTYTYDPNGNLSQDLLKIGTTVWDRTRYAYDLADRRTVGANNDGSKNSYAYDPSGNLAKVTNPDDFSLSFTYDGVNRIIEAFDQEGNRISADRDVTGKVKSVTDPTGFATGYTYWNASRNGMLRRVTLPAIPGFSKGRAREYDYDANGNVISVKEIAADASPSRVTLSSYDELNRPVRVVGPAYEDAHYGTIRPVTTYTYSLLGHLRKVEAGRTDSAGTNPASDELTTQMSYVYDDFGRKLKETEALGNSWRYTYDSNGNPRTVTDAKNQQTTYSWYYGHLLKSRNNSAGNVTITRNPLGQVTRAETMTPGNGSVLVAYDYDYDDGHHLKTVTDSRGPALIYAFSPGGLLKSIQDSHGKETDYLYDPAGRLSGIWAPDYGTITYSYDAAGRMLEKWLPNGVSTQYAWNGDNSLRQLINRRKADVVFSRHGYSYDGFGNRKIHAETIKGVKITYNYSYDNLNRLIEVSDGTAAHQENYSYDPLGNRTEKTVNATTPVITAYSYDAANQLLEARLGSSTGTLLQGFVYDANGSLVKKCSGGTVTRTGTDCAGSLVSEFSYDKLNRLVQAALTGLSTESYAYDNEGRRIRKKVGSATTNYLYTGPDIYAEYGWGFTNPRAFYTHGPGWDDPVQRLAGSTAKYYQQDGLGSVVGFTRSNGSVEATQRFDAWGNKLSGTGTVPQYGFTGREPDGTGLIYYRARYYDPTAGRFIQRDPIGFRGGVNLYAYVGNNPVNNNDPTGLWYIDINISAGFWGGITAGVLINPVGIYPYLGGGFVSPPGGISVTWSPSDPTTGWNAGIQGGYWGGGQVGYGFGEGGGAFGEVGFVTPGGSATGYYVWDPKEWSSNKDKTKVK